jgi:hypothetical protein
MRQRGTLTKRESLLERDTGFVNTVTRAHWNRDSYSLTNDASVAPMPSMALLAFHRSYPL